MKMDIASTVWKVYENRATAAYRPSGLRELRVDPKINSSLLPVVDPLELKMKL